MAAMRYNCAFCTELMLRIHFILGAMLALASCLAHAQQYRMAEQDARVGTNIKRNVALTTIAFNKPYAELPEDEKARLRGMYEQMGPDDEPPFPVNGYAHLMRTLADIRRKVHIEGVFDLGVIVGPDGRATDIKVYQSPDAHSANTKLTKLVAGVLMLEKYKPALCEGKPCTQEFPFAVHFTATRQ
ncbi:hypothetical protein OU994_01515 [Pseudoduganella sp. SL102]|uniref:hypothetical protein n=1 Tax=Pseudoduganella sp. SL102 TaxID=2995154 RepID=UPI00248CB910|nr:hypothetical protein [Pseudoduganella sp. SL102]WBS03013.1 hypothetical protein OU994_01515 [Pseudoduganella sp. SL102]